MEDEQEDEEEDEDEDEEEGEEEDAEDDVMEIAEETAKEEEKERKKGKPAKEKNTTKKRLLVPFFCEFKSEGCEAAVSGTRRSKKGKKAPSEDEERSVEEVCLHNALEDYGTSLTKLGQHVCQCLCGQPQSKTLFAAALQLMFECSNSILRGPLCIGWDYIGAQRKCMEPLRQVGAPQYEEYAGAGVTAVWISSYRDHSDRSVQTAPNRSGQYTLEHFTRRPVGPVFANCRKTVRPLQFSPFRCIVSNRSDWSTLPHFT